MLHANGDMVINNVHECGQTGSLEVVKVEEVVYAEEEMRQLIESRLMDDATKPAAVVAREVYDIIHAKYDGTAIKFFHFALKTLFPKK